MSEHIYVGSGREFERAGQKPWYRVQVDLTKIERAAGDHTPKVRFSDGEHTLINLIMSPLKPGNVTKYRSHSLKVDTWKPDPTKAKPADVANSDKEPADIDSLPF